MNQEELAVVLAEHGKWLAGGRGSRAILSEADLSRADLSRADLSGAFLSGAFLRGTNLRGADLSRANLRGAFLSEADLSRADLSGAILSGAILSEANLRWADLSEADLSGADLSGADLSGAFLSGADLSGADLRWADLRWADLSGVIGLLSPAAWLATEFETNRHGIIVYKALGKTNYAPPDTWVIAPGSYLTEVCNADRTLDCACGVNFGTREWLEKTYPWAAIWRCLIEWPDVVSICVPYGTDGKARCERLKLCEIVEPRKE